MKTSIINFCSNNYSNIEQNKSNLNNSPAALSSKEASANNAGKQAELNTKNKGVFAGLLTTMLIRNTLSLPPRLAILMKKISNVSAKENSALTKAADEILAKSGLKDKGVEIVRLAEVPKNNPKACIQLDSQDKAIMQEFMDYTIKLPLIKSIHKALPKDEKAFLENGMINAIIDKFIKPAKLGRNAFYSLQINKVIAPEKSLQTATFHELGHALDANGGIITKTLFKTRAIGGNIGKLAPMAILAASLFNKRKVNDETSENDTKKQKVMDFIKRNAGKLTALTLGICYIEEGIASLRGSKAAKELVKEGKLTSDLMKKINKTNILGFASYAAIVLLNTIAVKAGVAIKDKLQKNYEEKQNLKTTRA